MKASSTKHQASGNLQAPNTKLHGCSFGAWCLVLRWSLELGGWNFRAAAQTSLDDVIFTVGTTIADTNNQPWSYVLLGAPQGELLGGKTFAVFAKTNSATFTPRGTIFA